MSGKSTQAVAVPVRYDYAAMYRTNHKWAHVVLVCAKAGYTVDECIMFADVLHIPDTVPVDTMRGKYYDDFKLFYAGLCARQ